MSYIEISNCALVAIVEAEGGQETEITLIIDGELPYAETIQLDDHGPVGKVIQQTIDGTWVTFDAYAILAWSLESAHEQKH